MKELSNYITEKLDINKVNLDEFPIDGNIDTIANFLKSHKFTEIDYCYNDFVDVFNDNRVKGFIIDIDEGVGDYNIWFGNTTVEDIGRKNPLFNIKIYDGETKIYYTIESDSYKICKEKEFLKMIEKFSILK